MNSKQVITGPQAQGLRLDKFICDVLELFPRSQIDKRHLKATYLDKDLKASAKLKEGMVIDITWEDPPPVNYGPTAMELDILFENQDTVVINKPRGLVVHPGAGHREGTLAQGLLHHVESLGQAFEGEDLRPGIVHRLDKDTTGVVITAKTPGALEALSLQFREKTTRKKYFAVIRGELPQVRGEIQNALGRDENNRQKYTVVPPGKGKEAHTLWRVLGNSNGYSLVELEPRTGRTHQLRVHMAHLGCPILGDPIYSRKDKDFPLAPLCLHAYELTICLPGEIQSRVFRAPLPKDLTEQIMALGLTIPQDVQTA